MGNQGSLHKITHDSDRSDSPYGHYEPPLSFYNRQEKPKNVPYFDVNKQYVKVNKYYEQQHQQMGNQPNLFNDQNNPQSYPQYPQQSMDHVYPNFYNTPKNTSIFNQRNRSPTRLSTEYPQPGPNQGDYADNASFYSNKLQYQKAQQQPQQQPQQQQAKQLQQFQQQQQQQLQQQAQQQALLQQQQVLFQQHQQQQQQHQQQQQQRPQLEPQLQRTNPEPHQHRSHLETQQQPVQLHQLHEQQQKSVVQQLLDSRPKNPHESKPQFETNKFEQLLPNEALNSEMEQQGSFYSQQNQPFYLKQPESQYSQQVDKSRGNIPIPSNYTVQYHQGFAKQLQFTKSQCNEYYQNDLPNGNKPESGNFISQWYNDQGEIVQVANHMHDIPQIGLEQQPKDENELDEFRNMSPGSLERLYQNVPLCTMCSEKIQKHLDNSNPEEFNTIRGNMINISQCRIRGRSPSPTKLKKKIVSPSIDDTVNKEKTELISLYETATNYEFKPTPRRPNLGRSPSPNYLFSNPSLTKQFGYEAGKSMKHPSKEADNDKNSNNNSENSVSKNSVEDKCSRCGGWTLVRDQQNENGSKTNSPVREP